MASTTVQPKVIILCRGGDGNTTVQKGKDIANVLTTQFSVRNASSRVVMAAGDHRLLSILSSSNTTPVVFAVVSDDTNGSTIAGIVECVETQCPSPCVVLHSPESTEKGAARVAKLLGLVDATVMVKVQEFQERQLQAVFILDAQIKTESPYYKSRITDRFDSGTQITGDKVGDDIQGAKRISGKVRDRYDLGDKLALVTTDRQSGFDRMLALVPYKGQVLNLTSAFWFDQTKHIIPNHLISVPHPNVSIVKKCKPFPIEFVVRAYVTGSTSTSIWKNYQNGVRNYCGHELPEGLQKNQKLWKLLVTPTTKEEDHDRPISAADIVKEGWMTQADFDVCSSAALKCFALGQKIASDHGLILVDTKYEMGKDLATESIMMIDEMLTPDSSRYWLASSYEERIRQGMEPENIDKEFLRLWFRDHCDPYKDDVIPDAPKELVTELSRKYISLFEMITWKDFDFGDDSTTEEGIADAIRKAM